jgi:uncharacterized membrane protein
VRRVLWVAFRQHRADLLGGLALLAAVGALLVVSGLSMHGVYRADGVAACVAASTDSGGCEQIIAAFADRYVRWGDLLTWLNILPAFAGVLIGAPLIARELEHGTWKLAFTQTVTRTRWLTVTLAVVGLGVVALAGAFTVLFTWWRSPLDAIDGRIGSAAFNFEGFSLAAGALFAFAVGVLAGTLLRKTVAAMAISFLTYLAVHVPLELYLRPRYQHPLLRVLDPAATAGRGGRTTDWVLSQGWIDRSGHQLSSSERSGILQRLRSGATSVEQYMTDHGLRHYVQYQPDTRFWHFQLIEALLLAGLSGAILAASIWLVRRHTS